MFQRPIIEMSSVTRARSAIDALWADANVTSLRQALLDSASGEPLRSLLKTLLPGNKMLASCQAQWAEFKPGRRLMACYDVEIRSSGPLGNSVHAGAAAWRPSGSADSDEWGSHLWAACQA